MNPDTIQPIAALQELASRLRSAKHVVVLSGAGMSAESGIPTFRGSDDSLWRDFDPETLATPNAFRGDPALVWAWYQWRTGLVAQAQPNAGHRALARLESRLPALQIVTQNVDDLHERAGSRDITHLHGSLFAPRCFACARPHRMADAEPLSTQPQQRVEPPRCGHCGGRIRPGVVWFGESLPTAEWKRALHAVHSADLVLIVGTSGLVQPAASLATEAKRIGACLVEINPADTGLTDSADLVCRGSAATTLDALIRLLDAQLHD